MEALELGNAPLGSIEARAKLHYGSDKPERGQINEGSGEETVNCLKGADPDLPPETSRPDGPCRGTALFDRIRGKQVRDDVEAPKYPHGRAVRCTPKVVVGGAV